MYVLVVFVCVRVCVSLANDSSETVDVIIVKLVTLTVASNVRMNHVHVLIIWILTLIQGHTDRDIGNSECLITPETTQAMLVKFAVKIVRLEI